MDMIKKGDKVLVRMEYFLGKPTYEVEAKTHSFKSEGTETFSYLEGDDMMMIAKLEDDKWVSK